MSSSLIESKDVGCYGVDECVKTRRYGPARRRNSRIQGAVGRAVRHTHFRILSSFGFSGGVALATSLARIPLVISAIGSNGYGVALAVTSLQPWALDAVSSLTNLTRVSLSESLGRADFAGAMQDIVKMRHRARQLMLILAAIGLVLAVSVPWSELLHAQRVSGSLEMRVAILVNLWLLASAAPGAMSLGVLHADGKVALAQIFPAVAAVLSLAVTAVGWALHLGLIAFVVAPAIAACAPFWLAQIWERRSVRAITLRGTTQPLDPTIASVPRAREFRLRDFFVMSGAAAPPLFSTGLDPIVLSISLGPAAVAAYGLANRLGLLILVVQSALYPLYWAKFSKLRVAGDVQRIWKEYRKELFLVVAGTTVLAAIFLAVGPSVAVLLSGGKVARPMLLYWSVAALGILAATQTVTLPLLGGVKTAPKVAMLVFGLIIPNEALSYVLSRAVGPAGPTLASIAAALVLLGACSYILRRNPDCIISQPTQQLFWSAELSESTAFVGPLSRELGHSTEDPGQTDPSELSIEARRRWGRATWFGIATYFAWSPFKWVNHYLSAGSTTRGIVLTVIPLLGVLAVLRLPHKRRARRIDLLVMLLVALVGWQAISVETSAGLNYLSHVVPGVALLGLAVVARGRVDGMSKSDVRFALTGVLPALCSFLVLGWIAQFAHLVPSAAMQSAVGFSVHGYRLQGLTTQPNNLGFLAALVTMIAFVAQSGKMAWLTRIVGALTLLGTDSRTSIIALGFGLFALWVLGPGKDLLKRMSAALLLVIVGAGLWGILDVRRQANTNVLSGRNVIWHDLIPYLIHAPLFGFGPNIFLLLDPLIYGPYTPQGQILDAQNQWLSDSVEFGIVAAVLLTIGLIVIPLRGTSAYRWLLLFPLLTMVVVEGISEVPLSVFASIDGAFPLFLLVMWAPLRALPSADIGTVNTARSWTANGAGSNLMTWNRGSSNVVRDSNPTR